MIYFTSDLHLGHDNVLGFCDRPFKNVKEMNEALLENWNKRVKKDDTIYVLGDFALARPQQFSYHLNGRKYLVPGNHDRRWLKDLEEDFEILPPLCELVNSSQSITLCHYAMRTWPRSHYGAWHLFGHSHGNLPPYGKSFDVGVDCNNYSPISLDEVKERMSKLEWRHADYHDRAN